jgi:hypothetical protein
MSNAQGERRFTRADFLKLLELQRRSVQWLIIAKLSGIEPGAVDVRPLANDAVAMLLKLREKQLCN